MLARGTLKSGSQQIYLRKSDHVPDRIKWQNTSAGAVTLTVSAGPAGAEVPIDQGTIAAKEPAETDLRGLLETNEVVKVNCDTADVVTFAVTKVE